MTQHTATDPAPFHAQDPSDVLATLGTQAAGLEAEERARRLARHGPNQLPLPESASWFSLLLSQLRSVVVLLLATAVIFSVAVGDRVDAAAIGTVLIINTLLGFLTEFRAHRSMLALLRLQTPQAMLIRDGARMPIPAAELVPGDIIAIEAGAAIPADCRLIETTDLRVDESALTGESVPVAKATQAVAAATMLAERSNMAYLGTTAAAGSGRAAVTATGLETELGRIGRLVGTVGSRRTPLEQHLDTLGWRLAILAVLAGALVAAIGLLQGVPATTMVKTGIALAIAAVPEGLPAVATITLAVGVHRMAQRNAIVRRLPAVETLGAVTLLATDKTGTLTAGQMTATRLWVDRRMISVTGSGYAPTGRLLDAGAPVDARASPPLTRAMEIAALVNRAAVVCEDGEWTARGDPMEAALLSLSAKAGFCRDQLRDAMTEFAELPFSSERMLMATFNHTPQGPTAFVKGAPDAILPLCERILAGSGEAPLSGNDREAVVRANQAMAADGLRVLALAYGHPCGPDARSLPALTMVALAGFEDPPAPGVAATIATLHQAGIATAMVTGDQALTATAIARDIGIPAGQGRVVTGRALEEDTALASAARVFCRVTPEQKLELVSRWQRQGEIVAMIGDGVNDGPALRKADVGVAMGSRGTDVAREVAAIILRDDRFTTIGAAVGEGRVIYDNIRKFVFYLFSCNFAEVLFLLAAGVAGVPVPLTALQILWLNIVTDTFPALALAFEPAEPDVMERPPRHRAETMLSRRFLISVTLHAMLMAAVSLAAFHFVLKRTGSATVAGTAGFLTLGFAQMFHLGTARSRRHVLRASSVLENGWAVAAVVGVVALQVAAVEFAPLSSVLGTVRPTAGQWTLALALGAVPALAAQARRLVAASRATPRERLPYR